MGWRLGAAARAPARFLSIGLSCCAFVPGAIVEAQDDIVMAQREYNVKAVSLYAFGRYVTWPPEAFANETSPFVIGVLGGNPFGDALQRIAAKKKVNDRPIAVRQLGSAGEALECHIVFVSSAAPPAVEAELFKATAGKPVLLVGETPGFAARGGVINFYQSGNNVRFELNPDRGVAAHLSLNAKLLSLGTKGVTR
jgi:hypothetical protein